MGSDYSTGLGSDFFKKYNIDAEKVKDLAKKALDDGNLDFNEINELSGGSLFEIASDGSVTVDDRAMNNLFGDLNVSKQGSSYETMKDEATAELMEHAQSIKSQNEQTVYAGKDQTQLDIILDNYGEYFESIGIDTDDYDASDEDWAAISNILAEANPDLDVAWGSAIPEGTQINLPTIKIDENGKLVKDESTVSDQQKDEYLERIEDLMADNDGIKGTEDDLSLIPDDFSVEVDGQKYDKQALQKLFDPANLKNYDISGETVQKIYNVLASGDINGTDDTINGQSSIQEAISSVVAEYGEDGMKALGGEQSNQIDGLKNTTGLIDNGDGTYSVEVQQWGSDALDGNKNANDCLSRIIANYYPDVELYSEDYDKVLQEIMNRNDQIVDPNLIYTGDKIELPIPEYDENGSITGFKTPEDVKAAQEAEAKAAAESSESEETDAAESGTEYASTEGTESSSSSDGSTTVTTTADDGTKVTTTVDGDGSVTTTVETPDGQTITTTVDPNSTTSSDGTGSAPASGTDSSTSSNGTGNATTSDETEIPADVLEIARQQGYSEGDISVDGNGNYIINGDNNTIIISPNSETSSDGTDGENETTVDEAESEASTDGNGVALTDEQKADLEALGVDPEQFSVDELGQTHYYNQNDDGSIDSSVVMYEDGTKAKYSYDESGQISSQEYYDEDNNLLETANYSYDESGNLLSTERYDENNTLVSKTTNNYEDGTSTVEMYDESGRPTTITTFEGSNMISAETRYYEEDGSYTSEITDSNGEVTKGKYNADGSEKVISDEKAARLAQELYDAMHPDATAGLGTDDEEVKAILQNENISNADIIKIMKNYPEGRSLVSDIQGDFSGSTEDELTSILTDALASEEPLTEETADLIAKELNNAMYLQFQDGDWGTNEQFIEEMFEKLSDEELSMVNDRYSVVNEGRSLIDDIKGDFSFDAQNKLVERLQRAGINAEINTEEGLTDDQAKDYAQKLYDAMDGLGTDEGTVYAVLKNENLSSADIIKIMKNYPEGKSLVTDIQGDFSGSAEDELTSILTDALASEDPLTEETADLIAKELYSAMYDQTKGLGWGTNEQFIKEIFEKLSDESLSMVNDRYSEVNDGNSLKDDIKGDFSWGTEDELLKRLIDADLSAKE